MPARRPVTPRSAWTVQEDEQLAELWRGGWRGGTIAQALGRSRRAIYERAARLGLPKRWRRRPPTWTLTELADEAGLPVMRLVAAMDRLSLSPAEPCRPKRAQAFDADQCRRLIRAADEPPEPTMPPQGARR
jgi:hypothetical protein